MAKTTSGTRIGLGYEIAILCAYQKDEQMLNKISDLT